MISRNGSILISIFLVVACSLSAGAVTLDSTLSLKSIAPGVYVVSHSFPWQSNSLVVATGDSEVLMVDTPYTPEATEKLLAWIEKRFAPKKITAVVTHYHIDRMGGTEALLAHSIPVYGSDHTVRLLNERGERTRTEMLGWISDPVVKAAIRTTPLSSPDHIFPESDGLVLKSGEETVEISYPGPGHTPDNLVVYLRKAKVLFAGCVIIGQEKLGNVAEADTASWLTAMGKLAKFDATFVVPGHGGEQYHYSPELIEHTKKLLVEAESQAK